MARTLPHPVVDCLTAFAQQHGLSSRECQVLSLAAAGCETKQLSVIMGCSVATANVYWLRVMRKMGAASRAEVMAALLEFSVLAHWGAHDS